MDPFPLLEWLRQNGGTATGTGGNVALGAPASSVPAYCKPLQVSWPGPDRGARRLFAHRRGGPDFIFRRHRFWR